MPGNTILRWSESTIRIIYWGIAKKIIYIGSNSMNVKRILSISNFLVLRTVPDQLL